MFGAFAPAPKRLGGSSTEGVSAAQHARLAADLVSLTRTRKLAVLTIAGNGSTVSVESYSGANGSGLAHAPTAARTGTGTYTLTWDAVYEDAFEVERAWSVTRGIGGGSSEGTSDIYRVEVALVSGSNVAVTVSAYDSSHAAADGTVSVVVWGTFGPDRTIADYGGSLLKRDVETERVPYAWTFYQELTASLGSAFTTRRNSVVHARKLAMARMLGAEFRGGERLGCNCVPLTADDALDDWARSLNVRHGSDVDADTVREDCGLRIAMTAGPSQSWTNYLIEQMLGDALTGIDRYIWNDLDNPPIGTWWPGGTVLSGLNLGSGSWASSRAHLFVNVVKPAQLGEQLFSRLVQTRLPDMLDRMLPAHMTFDWGTDTDGFYIGVSYLGLDAL